MDPDSNMVPSRLTILFPLGLLNFAESSVLSSSVCPLSPGVAWPCINQFYCAKLQQVAKSWSLTSQTYSLSRPFTGTLLPLFWGVDCRQWQDKSYTSRYVSHHTAEGISLRKRPCVCFSHNQPHQVLLDLCTLAVCALTIWCLPNAILVWQMIILTSRLLALFRSILHTTILASSVQYAHSYSMIWSVMALGNQMTNV